MTTASTGTHSAHPGLVDESIGNIHFFLRNPQLQRPRHPDKRSLLQQFTVSGLLGFDAEVLQYSTVGCCSNDRSRLSSSQAWTNNRRPKGYHYSAGAAPSQGGESELRKASRVRYLQPAVVYVTGKARILRGLRHDSPILSTE